MGMLIEVLSWILLAGGSFFLLVGGLGLWRMPEFFTRMHAASLTDTGGATLILTGLMLQSGLNLITVKLIIVLFFILFTTPTATHALAKAALQEGLTPDGSDVSRRAASQAGNLRSQP
jgi:multicomponent Na+:H+ antiporter subunit G